MARYAFVRRFFVSMVGILFFAGPALAQWKTQSIDLEPGWNAIFLEVDPPDKDADLLLANIPIESVWMWNKRFSAVAFLTDPEDLLPEDPNWLVYFPANSPQAAIKNLYGLRGGQSYLVKLGGTNPVTLDITGTPVNRDIEWSTDSFNLVGFSVDSQNPPSVADYFESATQHLTSKGVFRLETSGRWVEIDPGAVMNPGEALWVYSQGPSSFHGPFEVLGSNADFLDYNRNADVLTFDLRNTSSETRVYTIGIENSDAPPTPQEPDVFGPVELSFFEFDQGPESLGSFIQVDPSASIEIEAGETRQVRLAVDRNEMGPIPIGQFSTFQSLVTINDGKGAEVEIPTRCFAINQTLEFLDAPALSRRLARRGVSPGMNASPYAGLWVGRARLENVNFPANLPEREKPVPAGGAFEFRLIVHVNDAGEPSLVKHVTLMSKDNGSDREVVLITDDALLGNYDGVIERGGETIGQRVSSINFPNFREPGEYVGTLPSSGGVFEDGDGATTDTLNFRVYLDYDDPLNPFKHAYHPDHDNLDPNFDAFNEEMIDLGGSGTIVRFSDTSDEESYSIVRDIAMEFSGTEPGKNPGDLNPGWLSSRIGGNYRENIYGLYRTDYGADPAPIMTPLVTTGTFSLVRISGVATLNDGVTP